MTGWKIWGKIVYGFELVKILWKCNGIYKYKKNSNININWKLHVWEIYKVYHQLPSQQTWRYNITYEIIPHTNFYIYLKIINLPSLKTLLYLCINKTKTENVDVSD